jgi:hypothetical protein
MLMTESLEAHLIELELRLQVSTTRKDAAALAELLSEDFREFGASGRVWNRASIIAEHIFVLSVVGHTKTLLPTSLPGGPNESLTVTLAKSSFVPGY